MRIGVDLDNTLICYNRAFLWAAQQSDLLPSGWEGSKREIREYLRGKEGGEIAWQSLQGQVYGRWINHAQLFPGAERFLWRCKQLGLAVEVVSHKTEYGHVDGQKIPLREVVLEFLKKSGIYSADGGALLRGIQFCSTREEKIRCIAKKKFDWFIDDLEEIFESKEFPDDTKQMLFSEDNVVRSTVTAQAARWEEIELRLLGKWNKPELSALASELSSREVKSTTLLGGGGNSRIARVDFVDGSRAALKFYSDDETHNRLFSEFQGSELIHQLGTLQIPKTIGCCGKRNVAMYQWIEGKPITVPDMNCFRQALNFLDNIHELREVKCFDFFPNASAAVFCGQDLEFQLRDRFLALQDNAVPSAVLQKFLDEELGPSIEMVVSRAQSEWPKESGYDQPLPREHSTLSPSDFGFHNALQVSDGSLIFLDFEYFGWDDPAKLVGDFVLHPGMHLSKDQKKFWIRGATLIYGSEMLRRMGRIWPMLGLCWCLILLNDFRKDYSIRRRKAFGRLNKSDMTAHERQLIRSQQLLIEIKSGYKDNLFSGYCD